MINALVDHLKSQSDAAITTVSSGLGFVPYQAAATDLTPSLSTSPQGMPLGDFADEVMSLLAGQPDAAEICVERVKPFRYAEAQGRFDKVLRSTVPSA